MEAHGGVNRKSSRSARREVSAQNDLAISGAKKAAKVAHRTAGEGPVGASVLPRGTGSSPGGVRAALAELNCETDFVASNALFLRISTNTICVRPSSTAQASGITWGANDPLNATWWHHVIERASHPRS